MNFRYHLMSVMFLIILSLCIHSSSTDIYTLSLHDALPILYLFKCKNVFPTIVRNCIFAAQIGLLCDWNRLRSEEHTSELQSRGHPVCRLLLEKKKQTQARPAESPPLGS